MWRKESEREVLVWDTANLDADMENIIKPKQLLDGNHC